MGGGKAAWLSKPLARVGMGLLPLLAVGAVVIATAEGLTPGVSSPATTSTVNANARAATRTTTTSHPATTSTSSTTTTTHPATTSTLGRKPTTAPPITPPTTQAVAPATTSEPPTPAGDIGVSDGHLQLNDQPYTFVGVNAYEIGTEVGVNPGCGGQETNAQFNVLFSSIPPNSLVRIWAFQDAIATNVQTDQLDWAPLDRVFAAAAAHGQRLVVALTDQGGVCDGDHWQDPSWYEGGFMDVFNSLSNSDGSGHTPLSYWDYMQDVVNRYKDSPALGMWEPISEAEASSCDGSYYPGTCWGHNDCPDEAVAAAALRYFFDVVGGEIHVSIRITWSRAACWGAVSAERRVATISMSRPAPESTSSRTMTTTPERRWVGISGTELACASRRPRRSEKPIIAGEMGLDAGTAPGCMSLPARSTAIQAKIQAQMAAGTSGVLVWDWLPAASSSCTTDTFPGDPLMAVLAGGPPAG